MFANPVFITPGRYIFSFLISNSCSYQDRFRLFFFPQYFSYILVTIVLSAQIFLIVLLILPLRFTGNDTNSTILNSINGIKCIQFTHPNSGERYALKVEYRTVGGQSSF